MKKFSTLYQYVVDKKGGPEKLASLLPTTILTAEQLTAISDDRYLAQMTKSVFQAGFYWKVIDNKWPGFESAFWHFNVQRCAFISPDDLELLYQDQAIVRNGQKIDTVARNAAMMIELSGQYGSFANMVATWPEDDFIGLLELLHQKGARLGKQTCQYFLRAMGKDGFVLMQDGIAALINADIISGKPNSKRDMLLVQQAFNRWRDESGFNYAQISKILALSIG